MTFSFKLVRADRLHVPVRNGRARNGGDPDRRMAEVRPAVKEARRREAAPAAPAGGVEGEPK
jgi:hypothetical protein